MTDTILKEMFREALVGEPTDDVAVHEDIARGRSRRTRVLRLRAAAGGVLVAATVAAGLIMPSFSGSDLDGEVRRPVSVDRGGAISAEVLNDPLRLAMWEAVDAVLDEDVRLQAGTSVDSDGPGPGLLLQLELGRVGFELSVLLQNARPDLPDYRPCSEEEPALGGVVYTRGCQQGRDDEGRWRGTVPDDIGGFQFLEGEPAAVTVQWRLDYLRHPPGAPPVPTPGPLVVDQPWFGAAEADAVADAVWAVGAEYDPADLASGIDLQATADTAWPAIEGVLAGEFGPLTAVEPVDGDIDASVDGVPVQTGEVSAVYRTADGAEVEVVVWQRDRPYEVQCLERYFVCERLLGQYVGLHPGPVGPDSTRRVGQRGSVRVQVNSDHRGLEMPVSRSVAGIMPLLPLIGEDGRRQTAR